MRVLLLGTDFMYNSSGNLIPIEINTNVGFDFNVPENIDDIFDLTPLSSFISNNNFTKVTYIGTIDILNLKLNDLCSSLNLSYDFLLVNYGSITVPYVEDSDDHLIIRSSYDTTAIVDEEYCKNKVNFLKLIKDKSFGTEFAYMDELGNLINNITSIEDNGNHPNFILKSVLPNYNHDEYPKLYKVTNQSELDIVLQNVDNSYFLMKCHYNPIKKFQNNLYIIRSLNIIFPPNLESITIGKYTRLTTRAIDDLSTFDVTTFEIDYYDKSKYITADTTILRPKLLDMDQVGLVDGTFKYAIDLQVGDVLKTVNIYNPYNVDLNGNLTNYHTTYDEFKSGTTYTTSTVTVKTKIDKFVSYVKIKFTDGTDWSDTGNSSYLVLKNNEVRFAILSGNLSTSLSIGDEIILIDTTFPEITTITKVVENITFSKIIFSGWEITVDPTHVFLTKTEGIGNESFAAIEHNSECYSSYPSCSQGNCSKGYRCFWDGSSGCYCG